MSIGPGFFSSALNHPDGLGRVYLADPPGWRTVVCEVAGVERWRVQAPDLMRELWAAAAPDGRVMIAAQGGETQGLTVAEITSTGQARWPTYFVGCRHAGVVWNGSGFVLYAVLNDGVTLLRIDVNSGFQHRSPVAVSGGTTLGFRQLKAGLDVNGSEDEIVYSERLDGNGYLERVVNGIVYRLPVQAGDVLIGQIGGMTAGVYLPTGERFLVCPEETRDPRLVAKGGLYLACGYLESNRAFVTTFPPFEPLPEPPPIDPPPPPIEDPLAIFYTDRLDVAQSVNEDHPELLQRARDEGEQWRGAFVDQLAHVLNRIDNDWNNVRPSLEQGGYIRSPWGRKRKNDGTLNTDALTFRLSTTDLDKKKLIDVVAGENFQPDWNLRPAEEEPGNGTWAPPQNPDLDLDEPEPPPPPIDPPPGLYPHETFLKYAQAAGVILAPRVVQGWNDLSQAARDEIFPHVRQRAIGQGDRYRSRQLNPTVMDLVIGGLLDLPTEQFDPLMEESIAAQKLLQPQSSALVRLRVEGTRFMRGTQPFLWAGCSAFDLPVRIAEGDFGFVDWMAETGFTLARIVVASVYRSPRTLSEGLRQLPGCLKALQDRGLYAEVVALVDTGPEPPNYNMSGPDMKIHVGEVDAICQSFPNTIIELFNERDHHTHADLVRENSFVLELAGWLSRSMPYSLGSSGGGAMPLSYLGDYLTVHTDRSRTPFWNDQVLRVIRDQYGKPVVSDEPQPVSEIPASRPDRTTDPAYGTALGESARQTGVAGVTFHCDAGLSARLSDLGPIQREAARRFIAAMRGN